MFSVLISGAGQLGSRHLQGLAKCRLPLRIYVQDVAEVSLFRASQRWEEVLGQKTHHAVSFLTSLQSVPREVSVAIVATTAGIRPQVVADICSHSIVGYWVLEKVLAQSESSLDHIVARIGADSHAWVNTLRRMLPWYQQIKSRHGLTGPLTLRVEGGEWGLACNAIHFLDLLAWWTGETLQDIRTDYLDPHWFEGKREGNWEVLGTMEAWYSGGSHAVISAGKGAASYVITVSDSHRSWQINEEEGLARRCDGYEIQGRLPFQSEISSTLVESILEGGNCDLPTLEESVAIHRVLIRGLQEHWKRAGHPTASLVPIT